jgi:hypothetical protein
MNVEQCLFFHGLIMGFAELGRLGLEPRTKALKGFYQRPMLSLRVS